MNFKRLLMAFLASGTLATGAQAATVCNFCDYIGPAGTYLGAHDATTSDLSTFQHIFTTISTGFADRWVFDIAPLADASASADFTALASIAGFTASLYHDGGSVCGPSPGDGCAAAPLGAFIQSDLDPDADQWKLFTTLAPGRYIIEVTGTTNADGDSAYTGQVSFEASNRLIPEPGTLALVALGVLGLGAVRRRLA